MWLIFAFVCISVAETTFLPLSPVKHYFGPGNVLGPRWTKQKIFTKNGTSRDVNLRTAQRMLSYMNPKADPCDDFYEYACGSFLRNAEIMPDTGATDVFTMTDDELNRQLNAVYEEPILATDIDAVKKVKTIYMSCINQGPSSKAGVMSLRHLMSEMGGWPVLGGASGGQFVPERFDLETLLAQARQFTSQGPFALGAQTGILFSMTVFKDFGNRDKFRLYFQETGLGLERLYVVNARVWYTTRRNQRIVRAYEEYAVNVATTLGADPNIAMMDMRNMVQFETELAMLTRSPGQGPNIHERFGNASATIYTLINRWPQFDWLKFINLSYNYKGSSISLQGDEFIYLWAPEWFDKMFSLLSRWNIRTIANYIIWRTILPMLPAVNEDFRRLELPLNTQRLGQRVLLSKAKFCARLTNQAMDWASSRLYIQRFFTRKEKRDLESINRYIFRVIRTNIMSYGWMSSESKTEALTKLRAITAGIGFPDYLFEDKYLNNYYDRFLVQKDNFFENVKNSWHGNVVRQLERIRVPDLSRWPAPPTLVNALYSNERNFFYMLAAFLQDPIYNLFLPRAYNYGVVGFFFAHEIFHGYDAIGINYDERPFIRNWVSETTGNNYRTRADCLRDQYNQYFDLEAGQYVNGSLTITENTADNGGLNAAFQALQLWIRENGNDAVLPGVDVSPAKLFFITQGQFWCAKNSVEFARRIIDVDHHSPARFRVIGPFQNSPQFAATFGCPVGSRMNPAQKCTLF